MAPEALVAAYRTVRTAMPDAYTEFFIEALTTYGFSVRGEAQIAAWNEAVETARRAADADPRMTKVLVEALTRYQHGLLDAGHHAEALAVCREMAQVGKRAFDNGVVPTPTFGSWQLACRLSENGEHEEAARLLDEIVRDDQRAGEHTSFWTKVAWIAELEAAGRDIAARGALRELIDEDRRKADQQTRAYAIVIWEQLFLAFIDRAHGREEETERCDQETEALLTMLAADGEPKNWSNILALWAVLIGVTGRRQDPTRPEGGETPLFSDLNWAPYGHRERLADSHERFQAEVARIAELAEREPSLHLRELVEVQRDFTVRSVKYWNLKSWRVTDELRTCFDQGVVLASKLVDLDEPAGRAALARALADRAGMHVAARDFPPALRDFQQARRVAAGADLS